MSNSRAISASDPQAVEKLTARLQECKEFHETGKEVNAYWRKYGTCMGAPGITDALAEKLDKKITSATVAWERVPYSDYMLKNNYAEMKRLEKRIAEISRNQEVGFSGWKFESGRAEANTGLNRLQIFFDKRLDSEKHSAMRHAGFVFSRTNDAYQRQLNDGAIYAAGRLSFVKPSDGRTVREHQPKAPARDDGAR